MYSTTNAGSYSVYQDFDPSIEWVREPSLDTLKVFLPGFRKDQLKVQVTSANNLKISGARQLNDNIWSRFRKEIPIPSNYDTNGISAKFEEGILYVRNPKLIVPESPTPPQLSKPTMEQSTKPPSPPQETPKQTKQEPPKTSSKPENITNEKSTKPEPPKPQETPKPTKQEPPEPSKPLQQPSKPENQTKEEPSKPLEAPKWQNPPGETPKPTEEEPSELDKPRTGKEKKEEVARPRKVTNKGTTSEQENAGKIEEAEALPEINESGSCKFVMENYKDSICGLIKELKNARNATNIVLAILFCAVLGLYIKNAVSSFMKSEN